MAAWLQWMWQSRPQQDLSEEDIEQLADNPSIEIEGIVLLLDKYGIVSVSDQVNVANLIKVYSTDVVYCTRKPEHGELIFNTALDFAKTNPWTSTLLVTFPNERSWDIILTEGRPANLKIVLITKSV